jgi:hypothetical protein
MRQLISAACLTAAAAISATGSAGSLEPGSRHQACAVLATIELLSDQELTFKWNNTCGFPIILKWRSQSDEGPLITGTLTLSPHQSAEANCTRCTLPEWTENWHGREA